MKRTSVLGITIISIITLFTGCASMDSIKLQEQALKEGNRTASAILYSKAFFQERFMGKEIVFQFVGGFGLQYLVMNYDKRQSARIQSGDFEKLLGDFDVSGYFDGQFRENIGKTRILKIGMEKNPERATQIAELIIPDKNDGKPLGKALKPNEYVAAFKISYGLAVRAGTEQIGLRKYYRPFIMLIGRVKHAGTQETVWQEYIVAFRESPRYLGEEASADKIKREELISTFKELTKDVIDMTVRSLNGEKLPEMPPLTGRNKADLTF